MRYVLLASVLLLAISAIHVHDRPNVNQAQFLPRVYAFRPGDVPPVLRGVPRIRRQGQWARRIAAQDATARLDHPCQTAHGQVSQ
jgi:hypothetical protein